MFTRVIQPCPLRPQRAASVFRSPTNKPQFINILRDLKMQCDLNKGVFIGIGRYLTDRDRQAARSTLEQPVALLRETQAASRQQASAATIPCVGCAAAATSGTAVLGVA